MKDVTAITIDNDKQNSRSTKWKEDGFAKMWLYSAKFFFRICCACSDDVVIRVHDTEKLKALGVNASTIILVEGSSCEWALGV